VRVALPGGTGVDLWAGETVSWLQAFTGDTLAPERRRRGLAVEPMSCPPGALASGRDLTVLEPGEEHVLTWGLQAW
jgi:galactose mutarotase-like enzyme